MGDSYTPYSGRKNITRWLNATWEKIAYIIVDSENIEFHRLHNPDNISDYHSWIFNRVWNERYGSYREYFKNIIGKHKSDQHEIESYEMYLFFGGDIVSGGGSSRLDTEHKSGIKVKKSQWDTPFAFIKIWEKRKLNWSYNQIVKYFRQIAPSEYRDKITSVRLRKIYSRGIQKLALYRKSIIKASNTL